ncbi:hydroxyphenylacetyl-CoA thioesterase PaaI [Magnetospira sp. QH-2]|uniref:hydroxyphenylacetyl-CoA thioesterase PaaI n=1 Tax=Magnetospira sp. (strain QH-2) TaxID=1288970 RepID=UPI0003E81221|nr:hydroxyphenylacetyl-CoA thioesterase PaaI [Magnetospira sp. QH-2]CCQ73513.1 Phenylacetate pathway hotdog-fold thioesterase [Magnetospira sp. QH-2]
MSGPPTDPQAIAEQVGRTITDGDRMAAHLGIELEEIRPGFARCRMELREDMANAALVGHGGVTFTLADVAFAHACNSHGRTALATGVSISFVGPATIGDTLYAEATEVSLRGRNGICDVRVLNQEGVMVALFRGQSLQLDRPLP